MAGEKKALAGIEAKFYIAIVQLAPFGVTIGDQSANVGHDERLIVVRVKTVSKMVVLHGASAESLARIL